MSSHGLANARKMYDRPRKKLIRCHVLLRCVLPRVCPTKLSADAFAECLALVVQDKHIGRSPTIVAVLAEVFAH